MTDEDIERLVEEARQTFGDKAAEELRAKLLSEREAKPE